MDKRTDNLYVTAFEEFIGNYTVRKVALFNTTRISEEEVNAAILNHTADTDMRITIIYDKQYDNLLDKVEVSEQLPYNNDEFLDDLHMEQGEQM